MEPITHPTSLWSMKGLNFLDMNVMSRIIHDNNKLNGFYSTDVPIATRVALILSEIFEGLEADRKSNRYAPSTPNVADSPDNTEFKVWFEANVKDTLEDELADTLIRLLDVMAYEGHEFTDDMFAILQQQSYSEDSVFIPTVRGTSYAAFAVALCSVATASWSRNGDTLDCLAYSEDSQPMDVFFLPMVGIVLAYCHVNQIDIFKHLQLKVRYNTLRGHMHGNKQY